jgi:hypothetical protein
MFILIIFGLYLHLICLSHGENLHPKVEAPYNNSYHAENKWLVMFFRTFGRGRPPIVSNGQRIIIMLAFH